MVSPLSGHKNASPDSAASPRAISPNHLFSGRLPGLARLTAHTRYGTVSLAASEEQSPLVHKPYQPKLKHLNRLPQYRFRFPPAALLLSLT